MLKLLWVYFNSTSANHAAIIAWRMWVWDLDIWEMGVRMGRIFIALYLNSSLPYH